jgi:hypothetical protein
VDALRSGNKKVSIALKGNPAFRLTGNGKTPVSSRDLIHWRTGLVRGILRQEALWRAEAQIRVIGKLEGSPPRSLAQISFRLGLQAPGDASEQKLAVRGPRFLPSPGSFRSLRPKNLTLFAL